MTRLYLVRHGETLWNSSGKYQGVTDIPLSEEGHRQADVLAERFVKLDLDKIYSSPLSRAYDTAKRVADKKNIDVISDWHFREINFGEWEGHTVPELKEKYGRPYLDFLDNPYEMPFPGDGALKTVQKRVEEGMESILGENEDKNIMIVSHGGIVRLSIMSLMELDGSFYRKLWIDNTGITRIDLKEGRRILVSLNDSAHRKMDENQVKRWVNYL